MRMHPHRRAVSFCVKRAIWIPVAIAALFASAPAAKTESARTETEGASAPNPQNVLVLRDRPAGMFSRWMGTPAATAATRTSQRPRGVKSKRRTGPAAAQSQPAETQPGQPAWPSPAATTGPAALVPITVKTVRELVAPPRDTPLVFENELSDIDLAAKPVLAATAATPATSSTAAPSTDGRSYRDGDDVKIGEQPLVFAMSESMRSITQAAWFEPMLLALAGALAALTAMRMFARV